MISSTNSNKGDLFVLKCWLKADSKVKPVTVGFIANIKYLNDIPVTHIGKIKAILEIIQILYLKKKTFRNLRFARVYITLKLLFIHRCMLIGKLI